MTIASNIRKQIFIGYDPGQLQDFVVCLKSLRAMSAEPWEVHGVDMNFLRRSGLYTRPTRIDNYGKLFDVFSNAQMSTSFAISRFLVPHLAREGWALFVDCDTMFRVDPAELFDLADPSKAVMCVKHDHRPVETMKKTGHWQSGYERKNWSSVMLFNVDHKANKKLSLENINSVPGRDLHRFYWLEDDDIGALPPEWNYLVGYDPEFPEAPPKLVHWTLGSPCMPGYERSLFADMYFAYLDAWVQNPVLY